MLPHAATAPPADVDDRHDRATAAASDAAARLVRALSSGAFVSHGDLASEAFGQDDREVRDRLMRLLDELATNGMPLTVTGDGVRARPFLPLDERLVAEALPHWQVRIVGSTPSTNTDLVRALRDGTSPALPTLRATEVQSAGRGRLGKTWRSGPGISLTASFALGIARRPSALEGATLVCGLAVRDVVKAEGVDATLKWPNDVLVADRKLAGILVEAHALSEGTTAIVIGIGINVAPPEGGEPMPGGLPPTDLATCGARAVDRNRLVAALARALAARFAIFASEGFAPFAAEWEGADAFRDRAVTLASIGDAAGPARSGTARGVDLDGALRLEIDGIVTRVKSGDLSLRAGSSS
jgi:BirA family biotin operon repressor/biotin-[acetyl-CoA-carboxylase] ligase